MLFPVIDDMLNRAINLDQNKSWRFVIDEEVKQEIIKLNTRDQLFDNGINSLDNALGNYSEVTVRIKRRKGQRADHVTLRDTGQFYDSFKVFVDDSGLIVFADDSSIYDVPLTVTWGIDILGLTDDSLDKLIREFVLDNYLDFILKEIRG